MSGDLLVALDLREHNAVFVGHDRYFVLHSAGRRELVLDRCPHRGGPLSLAKQTPDGRRLTCPWHGTKVGVAALRRAAVPMVRIGDLAVAVLAGVPAGTPVTPVRKHILANQPPEGER